MSNFKRWLWPGILLAAVLVLFYPASPRFRPVPGEDPAVFLYVGQRILEGGAPYLAAWDHKQPLAYLLFALGQALTPGSLWGMWWIELAGLAASALLGFRLLARVIPRPAAALAVIAGLAALQSVLWVYSIEELALPWLFLTLEAFAQYASAKDRTWQARRAAGLGALTGLAFLLKQSLIAPGAAALLLILLWGLSRRQVLSRLLDAALFGMGFTAAVGTAAAWLAGQGALRAYWDAAFAFNLTYSALGPAERAAAMLESLEFLSGIPALWLGFAAWIACALLLARRLAPSSADLLSTRGFGPAALLAGGGLAGLALAAELFGSTPGLGLAQAALLAAGLLLLAVGLAAAYAPLRARVVLAMRSAVPLPNPAAPAQSPLWWDLLALAVLLFPLTLALVALSGRSYTYYYAAFLPPLVLSAGLAAGALLRGENRSTAGLALAALLLAAAYNPLLLLASAYRAPANPPLPPVAAAVLAESAPGEKILVWGRGSTAIYFLTGRQAPSRYFFHAAVTEPDYNARFGVAAEVLRDLQADPPALFITEAGGAPDSGCPLQPSDEPNTPGPIFRFVCDRYRLAAEPEGYWVFRYTGE